MQSSNDTLRRMLALGLAASTLSVGCAAHTYEISKSELAKLAATAPEVRGRSVRVEQEFSGTTVESQTPVATHTTIVIVPGPPMRHGGPRRHHSTGPSGGVPSKSSNVGEDAKSAAIALAVLAVTALVTVAVVEASRFEGDVELHPMHPLHVFGAHGEYAVMPLAALDANTLGWADHAIVHDGEGPWRRLAAAPLSREGWMYGVLGGVNTIRSTGLGGNGTEHETGANVLIQLGYFPINTVGLVGSARFAWRDTADSRTVFVQRHTLELQAMPFTVGVLSLGGYAGFGYAGRAEDGIGKSREDGWGLIAGGQLQLDINTHLGITGRVGLSRELGHLESEGVLGLVVY